MPSFIPLCASETGEKHGNPLSDLRGQRNSSARNNKSTSVNSKLFAKIVLPNEGMVAMLSQINSFGTTNTGIAAKMAAPKGNGLPLFLDHQEWCRKGEWSPPFFCQAPSVISHHPSQAVPTAQAMSRQVFCYWGDGAWTLTEWSSSAALGWH